jgi:hypothetical protein
MWERPEYRSPSYQAPPQRTYICFREPRNQHPRSRLLRTSGRGSRQRSRRSCNSGDGCEQHSLVGAEVTMMFCSRRIGRTRGLPIRRFHPVTTILLKPTCDRSRGSAHLQTTAVGNEVFHSQQRLPFRVNQWNPGLILECVGNQI